MHQQRNGSWLARVAALCVVTLVMGVITATAGTHDLLVSPAAADPPPVAVQSGSKSTMERNVVVSPHGGWHAILVDRGYATQRFLISSDGSSWQSVPAPRSTSPFVESMAISDSGELYAIAKGSGAEATNFWRYTGSWSAAITVDDSQWTNGVAGEILTDGTNLVIIEANTAKMYKSTNDGSTWTTGQPLTGGFSAFRKQTIVAGGVIHVLRVSNTGVASYQRWDIATSQPLAVATGPVMPIYQWTPRMFAAPDNAGTIYIAALDRSCGLYIYKSEDSGDTWETKVASDPFPAEFTISRSGMPVGFVMRADGRIDAFVGSFAGGNTTILEVSHPADGVGGWSGVTAVATVPGDSDDVVSWPTQRSDTSQPEMPDVWVSVPHGSGLSDLYQLATPGTAVAAAAATPFTTSGSIVRTGLAVSDYTQFGPASVSASPGRAWEAALVRDSASGKQVILRSQDGANGLELPNASPISASLCPPTTL